MSVQDRYQGSAGTATGPARKLRVVTPHDTNELEYATNGILAKVAGDLSIVAVDDTDPVTVPIAAGQVLPIRAKIIRATGTSATGIVALIS